MWERGEETAIEIGIDLNYYWEITPKILNKYIRVYKKKQDNRIKEWDYMNHSLGKYISLAVKAPKKYPKKPFSAEEAKKTKAMTSDEMERMARRNTIILGGKINNGNKA